MPLRGSTGTPMNIVQFSTPKRRKGKTKRLRQQEARWAAKSGPVVIVRKAYADEDDAP